MEVLSFAFTVQCFTISLLLLFVFLIAILNLSIGMLTSESVVTGYVVEGSVTLHCQVQAYFSGQVNFTWKKGTNVLTNSPRYSTGYFQELLSSNSGFNLTTTTLSLTILNLNSGDEGNYTCVIHNGQEKEYTTSLVTSLQSRKTTGTQGAIASGSSTTTSQIVKTSNSGKYCTLLSSLSFPINQLGLLGQTRHYALEITANFMV